MEGVLKQMGVDLRHHIGQQLRLAALEDDDGGNTVHGAPDFHQAQQARFTILVQLRRLIRRRAGLADGIGQLGKQLGISPHQLSYVTHSSEGEGLLFYGSTILPFVDHFPKNTELYRIMTTKPQELKKKEDE